MNYLISWLSVSSAVFVFILGIFVFSRNPRSKQNIIFLFFCLSLCIWFVGSFLMFISTSDSGAIFWDRFIYLGVIFMPVFIHHFAMVYTNKVKAKKNVLRLEYAAAVMFLLLSRTDYFVKGLFRHRWGCHAIAQPVHHLFLFFFWLLVCLALYDLYCHYRTARANLERLRTKYVFFAIMFFFCIGGQAYLPAYKIPVLPYPFTSGIVLVTVLAYAIIKYRLLDIKLVVTNATIFMFSYIPMLIFPFWAGKRTENWLLATTLAVVMATLGPIIYRFIRDKAEARILSEQRRYQSTLMQAARGMVKIRNLDHLCSLITHICSKAMKVPSAYMFLYDEENSTFILRSTRYRKHSSHLLRLPVTHPLVRVLLMYRQPIIIDELLLNKAYAIDRQWYEIIKTFTASYNISILIPACIEKKCLAFVALGPKSKKQVYTSDDINVFVTLAHQTALAIENCLFLEETKKAQEKIFNAEKLATLGAMASGLSHQLNNRLQEFAFIGGDLIDLAASMDNRIPDDLRDDFDYLKKSLTGIENNVSHTAQIIRGVLNYARTEQEIDFKMISIFDVISPALGLLRVKHSLRDFEPQVNIQEDIPRFYGSLALLAEAVFNLIDNAYEAIEQREHIFTQRGQENPPKKIEINVTTHDNCLLFVITDNGIGIKEDDRVKMYAPFFTTKTSSKSGTGLGMYVIRRIIEENHHGEIFFESEYMKYCRFCLKIPLQKS